MNPVIHFDIPVSDRAKATTFYKETFGWEINDVPGNDYSLALTTETDEQKRPKNPGAINGGLAPKSSFVSQQPVLYVSVEDIDSVLPKITAAGGKVLKEKTPIGEWGAFAFITDPDGNVLGLHQVNK